MFTRTWYLSTFAISVYHTCNTVKLYKEKSEYSGFKVEIRVLIHITEFLKRNIFPGQNIIFRLHNVTKRLHCVLKQKKRCNFFIRQYFEKIHIIMSRKYFRQSVSQRESKFEFKFKIFWFSIAQFRYNRYYSTRVKLRF